MGNVTLGILVKLFECLVHHLVHHPDLLWILRFAIVTLEILGL